jgi:hypothetical protein
MSVSGGAKRKAAESDELDYDDLMMPALRKQCQKFGLLSEGSREVLVSRLTVGGGGGKRIRLASSDLVVDPDKTELECDICMVLMGDKIFLVLSPQSLPSSPLPFSPPRRPPFPFP